MKKTVFSPVEKTLFERPHRDSADIWDHIRILLSFYREYKNESYDEVIKKLIYIVKNLKKEPELSKETIKAIEAARERIKKGKFVSEEVAKQRLGL